MSLGNTPLRELNLISPERALEIETLAAKAKAYWDANATFTKSGWSSLSAELANHPDYANCPNDLRGLPIGTACLHLAQ